jgi:type IV pilus assembly protein PilM
VFGFNSSITPLLGVDISSSSVKILEISNQNNQYRIENYIIEPLPLNSVTEKNIVDVDSVGETIGRAVAKISTKKKSAACAVAGAGVISKIISVPAGLRPEELDNRVKIDAGQYIPFPLEEVNLDYEVLGGSKSKPNEVDVLLAASRSDDVDIRVAALEIGGLTASIVDVEEFVLENVFSFLKANDDDILDTGVIGVMDIGSTTSTLSVFENNSMIYSRDQNFGGRRLVDDIRRRYNFSYEEATSSRSQSDFPPDYESEVLEPFKEATTQEVNRALQFFHSSSQVVTLDQILLAGGCASIKNLAKTIEIASSTPTLAVAPFQSTKLASGIDTTAATNDAPALITALGLAMRSFD